MSASYVLANVLAMPKEFRLSGLGFRLARRKQHRCATKLHTCSIYAPQIRIIYAPYKHHISIMTLTCRPSARASETRETRCCICICSPRIEDARACCGPRTTRARATCGSPGCARGSAAERKASVPAAAGAPPEMYRKRRLRSCCRSCVFWLWARSSCDALGARSWLMPDT